MNVVLLEPEMPANTGNIGRTCVATGTKLHLIEPLGFKLNDKLIKRAGLDYWDKLDVTVYCDYQDFLDRNPGAKIYMATTKGLHVYSDVRERERRNSGGYSPGESGAVCEDSHVGRHTLAEPVKLGVDCAV